MRRFLLVLLVVMALPLQGADIKATTLYYRISEPGIDPYLSRWLITDKFMRIDEGDAADNFILFDRSKKTVHSVVHGDRTVLDIPYRAVDKQGTATPAQKSHVIRDEKFPAIEGRTPVQRELQISDTFCYGVVAVEGVLPEAVQAMREYRIVMAGEHAKNMVNTPVELQQPCELVLHIFAPLWLLEGGLPIQEWSAQGRAQALLDYRREQGVDGALFTLPPGYRHYQTQTMQ